jgi:hypothetical protein
VLLQTKPNVAARVCVLVFGICVRLQAMDRWTALSQVESGDNDHAVGRRGEVSRYQMLPEVWRRYAWAKADWRRPSDSLSVARLAMSERCLVFERRFGRRPTDIEFYVLWNAPAQILKPSRAVFKRAERFRNLLGPESPVREAALERGPGGQPPPKPRGDA